MPLPQKRFFFWRDHSQSRGLAVFSITESRHKKIQAAVEEAVRRGEAEKEERRWKRHGEVLAASRNGRQRFSVQCRECRAWCIRNRLQVPIFSGEHEGEQCPLCQECPLNRASIV